MRFWTSVFLSTGLYKYFEVSQQHSWLKYVRDQQTGNENKAGKRDNITGKHSDVKGGNRRKMRGK